MLKIIATSILLATAATPAYAQLFKAINIGYLENTLSKENSAQVRTDLIKKNFAEAQATCRLLQPYQELVPVAFEHEEIKNVSGGFDPGTGEFRPKQVIQTTFGCVPPGFDCIECTLPPRPLPLEN